jgi:hypothetical protein
MVDNKRGTMAYTDLRWRRRGLEWLEKVMPCMAGDGDDVYGQKRRCLM